MYSGVAGLLPFEPNVVELPPGRPQAGTTWVAANWDSKLQFVFAWLISGNFAAAWMQIGRAERDFRPRLRLACVICGGAPAHFNCTILKLSFETGLLAGLSARLI